MQIAINKRKLESYKTAEAVAQVARKYLQNCHKEGPNELIEHVLYWMKVTGDIKYEKPKPPPKRKPIDHIISIGQTKIS